MIRVMPNLPTVVQSAACVFARGTHADDEDADMVTEMLNCVGLVEEMPEHHMDAVTGLSGNGPAYVSQEHAHIHTHAHTRTTWMPSRGSAATGPHT